MPTDSLLSTGVASSSAIAMDSAPKVPKTASVRWDEPACLIHSAIRGERSIVFEGIFKDVASALSRIRLDTWHEYTVTFPERRVPPFRYEQKDFARHVIDQSFGRTTLLQASPLRKPGQ